MKINVNETILNNKYNDVGYYNFIGDYLSKKNVSIYSDYKNIKDISDKFIHKKNKRKKA